ncbi:response regulator [candidate division KSB1 bacterium]|nr:response regulator [candidate division KSB1 bacterium]
MQGDRTRVMVVEDEKITALELQDRLTSSGYHVSAMVSTGEEALEQAQANKPDLALMDIKLKGFMDGVQAAELIRARLDIPIIYLTAYADKETLQRAKITEPFGYILKPFDERELYTTIEMALYKHKMERKLKESEQWFSTTLNSISDAVIATNKDGYITFLNPIAERLTGWSRADAIGESLSKIYNVLDEKSSDHQDKESDHDIGGVVYSEFHHTKILISKNGTQRLIDDSMAPIQKSDGMINGVVLVFRDISERRKFEQELIKTQKLESLGVLAGGIAHDFNNVLTAIIGNISIAKLNLDANDDTYKLLMEVENASKRAKSLTRQLLTFSKGGEPVRKLVSIKDALRNAASFALKGSSIQGEFSFAPDLMAIEADEAQLTQAIYNIINNARQAKPKDSRVLIRAENVKVGLEQKLAIKPGPYIKVTIIDQGSGIRPEHLTKIFDPYFTTRQNASGLGLAISYSIVKKHDGNVLVESVPDKGTKVTIYIPASEEKVAPKRERDYHFPARHGNILVMDDEPLIRNLVKRMLNIMGHSVETANHGQQAIELYSTAMNNGNPYDVVILDLTVQGGMGGQETIERLRKLNPDVKAIVSSGYSNDPIMANFADYGFSGVVAKPYETHELNRVINDVMK